MTSLEYRGYRAHVEADYEEGILFGRVLDIRAVITFAADRVDEVADKFHEAIDDYIAWCAKRGKEPERPFSGRLSFRTTPEYHRLIAEAAEGRNLSTNAWMEHELVGAAHRAHQQFVRPEPKSSAPETTAVRRRRPRTAKA